MIEITMSKKADNKNKQHNKTEYTSDAVNHHSTSPILSYRYSTCPYRPLPHCKIWVEPLTDEPSSSDKKKSFSSCVLQQPPMRLTLKEPKHWSILNVEKSIPCVWVWFLSSLILTVVIQCVSQAGIFSAGLNVMIFIKTCPRLLDVSYRTWHHCPGYRVVFTYD